MATKANPLGSYEGYYVLVPRDQEHLNLVLLRKTRPLSQKEKLEGRRAGGQGRPPNIEIPEKYARLMCPACSALDPYDAFEAGFDQDVKIRINGDFAPSDDGVFLISKRMLLALQSKNVQGIEAKPVGKDWFALKITHVVDSAPKALKASGRKCPKCSRPEEMIGAFERVSEINPPIAGMTLFTARSMHVGGRSWFRTDVRTAMVTGDVVAVLAGNGITGSACRKLLSDEEWQDWQKALRNRDPHTVPERPGVVLLK
jgi:hypothetical protein